MTNPDLTINVQTGGYAGREYTEDGPMEVWVNTYSIVAEDTAGHRWQWDGREFSNVASAKAVLRHIDVATPATSDRWLVIEPRYGSDAWGDEDEYALACFEADCFGEARPHW